MRLLTPDESGADGRGPKEREAAASARLAAAFSATAGPGSDLIDLARRLARCEWGGGFPGPWSTLMRVEEGATGRDPLTLA